MHSERKLVAGNPGGEIGVVGAGGLVLGVVVAQSVEQSPLHGLGLSVGAFQIEDGRRAGVDEARDRRSAADDEYVLERARYQQGVDPFLNSLEAERTLYAARRTHATTRLIRADNLVTLYRTLGGDQLIDGTPSSTGKTASR